VVFDNRHIDQLVSFENWFEHRPYSQEIAA
jgi:hypothetical protein